VGKPYTDKNPGTVTWKHEGDIVGVHNHPNNTPFSEVDIYSFASNKETRALSIQGHDGCFYILARNKADLKELIKDEIQQRFEDAMLFKNL
jgi:hypothetical protein